MIKAATALLGGNLGVAFLKFARNILVARLLSVENFGVASTFAIIFGFIEMLGFLGLDRFLIQTREEALERVQATLHTLQVLRGVLVAAVLFLTAGPLAEVMDVSQVAWAFQVMALLPLMQGFMHLDIARAQRDMRFGPFVKISLGAELLGLLSIWPLHLVFGDYRIVLGALLAQQILIVLFSHMVSERRYHLGWDRGLVLRALGFGWPLLFNAALMFGIFQGDRIIVANQLGPVDLGLFSLAFMLTFMPTGILNQTINRLFLPKLAPLQDDPAAFGLLARVVVQVGLVGGLAVAVGFSLFGADLVLIVFGAKYAGALGNPRLARGDAGGPLCQDGGFHRGARARRDPQPDGGQHHPGAAAAGRLARGRPRRGRGNGRGPRHSWRGDRSGGGAWSAPLLAWRAGPPADPLSPRVGLGPPADRR